MSKKKLLAKGQNYYNCSDPIKIKALSQFKKKLKSIKVPWTFFINEFDNSLSSPLQPLSYNTFIEQIEYFKKYLRNYSYSKYFTVMFGTIQSFYAFYQLNYDNDLFEKDGYSTALLTRKGIAKRIALGYHVINHNKLDRVPKSDQWIFCYKETVSSTFTKIREIDFTIVENSVFRFWLKSFIWHYQCKMSGVLGFHSKIIVAFNYIDSLKTQKIKSYFVTKINNLDDINVQEARAYKQFILSTYDNLDTQFSCISIVRQILNYINDNKIHRFEPGVFIELKHISQNITSNNSNPISSTDLVNIVNVITNMANNSVLYRIYYIIFYLAIETEFRFSQLCNLQIDCVKPTAKKNEFVILSETKTSNQEKIEQPITLYTKKCIEEAIELTNEYRISNTDKSLDKILFITPKYRKGFYGKVTPATYNNFLKQVCNLLNLENTYTVANLRDTHMTMAESYIIKQHLSDTHLSILTSHSSSTTTIKHYAKPDIIEMLETTNGVIIGDVDIQGNIMKKIPKDIEKVENLVSDECGYCSATSCHIYSDLSCMLCKNFITTIKRKPYFEEQLKLIDCIIRTKDLPHDKEDLINRKRLILGYLKAIIELEEEYYEQ